jgi:hypothetical protein
MFEETYAPAAAKYQDVLQKMPDLRREQIDADDPASLMQRAGQVVTRATLFEMVWRYRLDGTPPTSSTFTSDACGARWAHATNRRRSSPSGVPEMSSRHRREQPPARPRGPARSRHPAEGWGDRTLRCVAARSLVMGSLSRDASSPSRSTATTLRSSSNRASTCVPTPSPIRTWRRCVIGMNGLTARVPSWMPSSRSTARTSASCAANKRTIRELTTSP